MSGQLVTLQVASDPTWQQRQMPDAECQYMGKVEKPLATFVNNEKALLHIIIVDRFYLIVVCAEEGEECDKFPWISPEVHRVLADLPIL